MKTILIWFEQRTGQQLSLLVLFLLGGYLLWTEYQGLLLGALPYLIFLLCPLMHLFMHKGHGGSESASHDDHSLPDLQRTKEAPHD